MNTVCTGSAAVHLEYARIATTDGWRMVIREPEILLFPSSTFGDARYSVSNACGGNGRTDHLESAAPIFACAADLQAPARHKPLIHPSVAD